WRVARTAAAASRRRAPSGRSCGVKRRSLPRFRDRSAWSARSAGAPRGRWRRCAAGPGRAAAARRWRQGRREGRAAAVPPRCRGRPRTRSAARSLSGRDKAEEALEEYRPSRVAGQERGRVKESARRVTQPPMKHTGTKHLGFLSFGHWTPSPQSQTRTAADALQQSIELAVAAEEIGADGAYFRVHHFARQLGSPFPLLAACGARTKRIEIGTAVIDMRYENPLYMAEDAGAADLIAGGRLQLGISRGSPEQVIDGFRYFGYAPPEGETDADMARRHTEVFLEVLKGEGFAFPNPSGLLRLEPHSETLRERIWWGAGTNATAEWAAKLGMNLQSSTLKIDESGKPFHVQQAEQIRAYRAAWAAAGHKRSPRVSVSRSIFALVDDRDRLYFGG